MYIRPTLTNDKHTTIFSIEVSRKGNECTLEAHMPQRQVANIWCEVGVDMYPWWFIITIVHILQVKWLEHWINDAFTIDPTCISTN